MCLYSWLIYTEIARMSLFLAYKILTGNHFSHADIVMAFVNLGHVCKQFEFLNLKNVSRFDGGFDIIVHIKYMVYPYI